MPHSSCKKSTITLNVNTLNIPTTSQRLANLKTHMIQLHAVYKKPTSNNDRNDTDAVSEFVKFNNIRSIAKHFILLNDSYMPIYCMPVVYQLLLIM